MNIDFQHRQINVRQTLNNIFLFYIFKAYAAGCNIVILASNFERVQIIPGAMHGYVVISALKCSMDTGKIVAAYENTVCVFEPIPLNHMESAEVNHKLPYR